MSRIQHLQVEVYKQRNLISFNPMRAKVLNQLQNFGAVPLVNLLFGDDLQFLFFGLRLVLKSLDLLDNPAFNVIESINQFFGRPFH